MDEINFLDEQIEDKKTKIIILEDYLKELKGYLDVLLKIKAKLGEESNHVNNLKKSLPNLKSTKK